MSIRIDTVFAKGKSVCFRVGLKLLNCLLNFA